MLTVVAYCLISMSRMIARVSGKSTQFLTSLSSTKSAILLWVFAPPFWQSVLFKATAVLLFSTGVHLIVDAHVKRLKIELNLRTQKWLEIECQHVFWNYRASTTLRLATLSIAMLHLLHTIVDPKYGLRI